MSRGIVMTESTMDFQKVKKIQFGLLDPKEIVSPYLLY